MNVDKIKYWALTITACGAAIAMLFGPVKGSVESLIAQEAQKAAAAEMRQQMQPAVQDLASIKDLLRRQEDRAALQECREYRTQLSGAARERRCRKESDYRWARWAYDDCVNENGADHPKCQEPDPLPET